MGYRLPDMKSWRSSTVENPAPYQVRWGAQTSMVHAGLLHLVTPHDVQALRSALAIGSLPLDFEVKLNRLRRGEIIHRYVEQNSRLIFELLLASLDGSFNGATPVQREHLLRLLAYVRKDDDAIPDYLSNGFTDDQQAVHAAASELAPILQAFKAWRLRHQVPKMWRG
jgi:hypothetical protein